MHAPGRAFSGDPCFNVLRPIFVDVAFVSLFSNSKSRNSHSMYQGEQLDADAVNAWLRLRKPRGKGR